MKPIEFRGKGTMSYNKTEQPTAEGAEENIIYHNLTQPFRQILQSVALHGYDIVFAERDCVKCATEFAALHAQRLAEKMVEKKLIEFGNMIRDEPNGDIPALAEYFIRTINLKSSERDEDIVCNE